MMTNNESKYFLKGLTLIELIVSIGIIGFVTAIFVGNYRNTNKRTDLIMTAQSMVSDFHQAQNNALGLLEVDNSIPAGGWGISINTAANKNQYIIFADLDERATAVIPSNARIIPLPPEIEISEVRFADNSLKYSANVIFFPPDPRTDIVSGSATSTALEIDLKEVRNGSIKTVRVNFLGLVEVIN